MMTGGFPGSYNDDVLNAEPENEESRARLVEEIKTRAKGCIAARNYPEAINLYTKGISLTSLDAASQSVLYANRSMIFLNMSKAAEALSDAEDAIRLDPSYIKAYYRKAMACSTLNQFTEAKDALTEGLSRKPDDKELLAQLQKTEEKIRAVKDGKVVPSAAKKVSVSHNGPTKTPAVENSSSAPVRSSTTSAKSTVSTSSSSSSKKEEVDDEEDSDIGKIRGYKKTSDGRTTTFFNHELDEETKKLIGNIAPKKLDAQGEVITTGTTVGSAWNAAGTYEEKILTPWVNSYLRDAFRGLNVNATADRIPSAVSAAYGGEVASVLLTVDSVDECSGDAQVTLVRGKKKHLCDFNISFKYTLLLTFASSRAPMSINGQLSIADLSADEEYEIQNLVVTKLNGQASTQYNLPIDAAAAYQHCVKGAQSLLQAEIRKVLNVFWTELKSK